MTCQKMNRTRIVSLAGGVIFAVLQLFGAAPDIQAAKSKLQAGINTWSLETLKEARDMFIECLMKDKTQNAYLLYYVALADYRLTVFSFSSGDSAEAERYYTEAQQYLEKLMALDPALGEAFALYGYLLGMELALHPDRAMALGPKSFEYFDQAMEKDPSNPRVFLLKGIYQLYVPEAYGGGPASALEFLEKAASLFEKETVADPIKPSWGKDEAYTYLGMVYKKKNELAKAREMLMKALAVNPDFGLAKSELAAMEKKDSTLTL